MPTSRRSEILAEFKTLIDCSDEKIDLARCALAIAKPYYPNLNSDHYLNELDHLAESVSAAASDKDSSIESRIKRLSHALYRENGFHGAEGEFFDARNCHLNEVLEQRSGMPILLALVYIEISKRVGIPFQGISFPGHFLIRFGDDPMPIILDPFSSGTRLFSEQLLQRLGHIFDAEPEDFSETLGEFTQPCSHKEFLLRILRNLKSIYFQQRQYGKALETTEFILAFDAQQAKELRDRGIIHEEMECTHAAIEDYQQFLLLAGPDDDHNDVLHRLEKLRYQASRLH